MKVILVVGLVLVSCLQANARSISAVGELPKLLQETLEQAFSCSIKVGRKVDSILPYFNGLEQLPEDNEILNEVIGCIFVKRGIINENAEVNSEKLEDFLVKMFTMHRAADKDILALAHGITNTCKTVHADNYGLKSVKIQNCINGILNNNVSDDKA